jgi:hypothetical protein
MEFVFSAIKALRAYTISGRAVGVTVIGEVIDR